jgi:hypothetical protein
LKKIKLWGQISTDTNVILSQISNDQNYLCIHTFHYLDIMKEGSYTHVPWMVGITDDEGAFKASALMHDKKAIKVELVKE